MTLANFVFRKTKQNPARLKSQYLYLLIDIGVLLVPLLLSFHGKVDFSKKWPHVIPALLASSLFFVAWDSLFTSLRVWRFNPRYFTGIEVFNLPLEVVLFFFCFPYACMFTVFALKHIVEKDYLFPHHEVITSVLIIASLITGIYFLDRLYTSTTFLLTGFFLAYHMIRARPAYMGRFYFAFAFLLIPFLLISGLLTGSFTDEPVVIYNNEENMNVRIGTIPLEDVSFGMMMILIPVYVADKIENLYPQKRKTLKVQGPSIIKR